MIWVITERQIIYAVYKMRRHVPREARSIKHGLKTTMEDVGRWERGVLSKEFYDQLFAKEFGHNSFSAPFKYLITYLRPAYMKTFQMEVIQMLQLCIKQDYLEVVPGSYPERIRDTVKGRRLLSVWYFPRKVIEYEPVRVLLKELIKWSTIAFLGYIGITHAITAAINQQ